MLAGKLSGTLHEQTQTTKNCSDQTIDCVLCIEVHWQGVSLFWLGIMFSKTLKDFESLF